MSYFNNQLHQILNMKKNEWDDSLKKRTDDEEFKDKALESSLYRQA